MTTRAALTVALDRDSGSRLTPLLRVPGLRVDGVAMATEAVQCARTTAYEIVVCAFPLPDMILGAFCRAIRGSGSQSRDAAMLVLTLPEMRTEASRGLPRGRALVCARRDPPPVLAECVRHLLQVAPRRQSRAEVELDLASQRGRLSGRVVNISASGMLVDSPSSPALRADGRFRLRLGDGCEPLRGSGQVVRYSSPRHEGVNGFALRFSGFAPGDHDRLCSYLGS
jgi:DNA-binding NarL/FixJ family response regulator